MGWSVQIPAVPANRFEQTVDMVLQRDRSKLSPLGALGVATLACELAKSLVAQWDVAQVSGRSFGATIAGDTNPEGEPPPGFPNDRIEVKLWRSS